MVYRFAEYRIDPSAQIFLKHGTSVPLSAPCFLLLQTLLENPGATVSRQTLLQRTGSSSDAHLLKEILAELRRALDDANSTRWIEETSEGGARFLGTVSIDESDVLGRADLKDHPVPVQEGNEMFRLQDRPPRHSHSPWVIAMLLAGLAAVLYISHRNHPEPLPVVLSARPLTHSGREKLSLVLSPDGKTVWYTEQDRWLQIWQLSLSDGTMVAVPTAPLNEDIQSVSADGARLLIRRSPPNGAKAGQAAGLWQTDRNGKNARLLVPNGWSGAWSPDGRKLAYSRKGDHGIYLANADGSHAHRITRLPGYPWYLAWSPEGDRLMLASIAERTPSQRFPEGPLYRVFVKMGGTRPIQDDTGNVIEGSCPLVASDRHHILFTHTEGNIANVWEVDRQNGHLLTVTSDRVDTRLEAVGPSPNQIITARETLHGRLFRLQAQNRHLEPFPARIETRDLAFSPDGKWIAYVDLQGVLWQAGSDGSHPVRLLDAKWKASEPVWAPDSRQLIVSAAPQGGLPKLYRLPAMEQAADATANAITTGMGTDRDASWSPDGKHVLFCRMISGVSQLKWLNLDSGSLQDVSDSRGKCSAQIAPHDLLSATDDANQTLFIRRGLNGAWERIVTDARGIRHNLWSRDGRSLYFLTGGSPNSPAGTIHGQWKRYDLQTGSVSTVADLGIVSDWVTGPWRSLALTANDDLVISFDISGSELYLVALGSDN